MLPELFRQVFLVNSQYNPVKEALQMHCSLLNSSTWKEREREKLHQMIGFYLLDKCHHFDNYENIFWKLLEDQVELQIWLLYHCQQINFLTRIFAEFSCIMCSTNTSKCLIRLRKTNTLMLTRWIVAWITFYKDKSGRLFCLTNEESSTSRKLMTKNRIRTKIRQI